MPAPVIAAIIAGSAGLGAAALSSKGSQSAANTSSAAAQHAADLQAKAAADALAYQKTQAAQDQSNFNTTQQANYNQWASGQNRMRGLDSLVGLPQRDIPAYQQPQNVLGSSQTTPTSGTMPTGGSGSDPASYTLSLVSGGMSPQQAAAQTNQKFNLQTGSEAVYYPDSNTIGLPNAYLAGPTNKPDSPKAWGIVPRSGGGSAAPAQSAQAPASLANYVGGNMMPSPVTPSLVMPRTAYQPRSIAQLFGS